MTWKKKKGPILEQQLRCDYFFLLKKKKTKLF